MEVALTTRDHIERAATVYGDRIGIIDEPDQSAIPLPELTYRDVMSRSKALSAGLEGWGIETGDRVAIVSQNASRMLVFLYAVTGWGRVAVPVNFRLNRVEVQYIIDHSGAQITLVDPELMQVARTSRSAASLAGRYRAPGSAGPQAGSARCRAGARRSQVPIRDVAGRISAA